MRRLWGGLGCMLATLVSTAGCATKDFAMRPPKHPEEIMVPPEQDRKFSLPPEYPKETLNQDDIRRPGAPSGLNGMPGGGMGGRGGGMGGMGPGMGGMGGMAPNMGGRPY